jgi:oligoendopeptidase F
MPKIINDTDGNEIEVFTQSELETQKVEVIEQFKKDNPDKAEELKIAQEELEKLKGKDMNFANLRAQKEAADKKVEDILKGVDEKVEKVKREVLEGVMKDHYNDTLKNLSGGDKEIEAKIELQYKRIADTAGTKEEIVKKLKDAALLAGTNSGSSFDNSVFSSGGVSRIKVENKSPLNDDEKDLLVKLANAGSIQLKPEDLK